MQFRFSSPFRFNLQQVNILGAYDRYEKELEERKKEELYENKLVEQQVDDFTKYYNPKSVRENDLPLLQSSFKNYEVAAKQLNKARRIGNTDEINKNRESMQKAIADMGDVYNKSVIAKKVAADMATLKDQERKGLIVIDDNNYKNYFNLFTAGNLNDIENAEVNGVKLGKPDTWGNVMTGVEYTNNKHNEGLAKVITAFNSNKNNFIQGEKPLEYQTQKIDDKELRVPVFEKVPDYNKALQLASLQPEPMKKKVLNQFNTELAQGGAASDIARVKQEKIARIFNKPADQLTANELLAYSIAGDARKEADFKQGRAVWQMEMDERKQDYREKVDAERLKISRTKAANKGSGSGKVTAMEMTLLKNYYDESKSSFTGPDGKITPRGLPIFKSFLEGIDPKILGFIHKAAPKTKEDPIEMNKVLQGYMKNPQSLFAAMGQ